MEPTDVQSDSVELLIVNEPELYATACSSRLAMIEDAYLLDAREARIDLVEFERVSSTASDIEAIDLAWCLLTAATSMFITTNKAFEKWCEGVHNAASGNSGDYDFLQKALGVALHHEGDAMDWMTTRDGQDTWRLFHRLLWGHDPLAFGGDLIPHNPIAMMIQQRDDKNVFLGSLQAMRHLVADTFSKQGLPLPGSSWLDTTTPNGRPWNKIIDIVQELSRETHGNALQAEALYEHLFTIRAQDVIGGGAAIALASAYILARKIEDDIRKNQIKLTAYSMSFFGQAIVGAVRQHGVPYINYPLGAAMAKELVCLLLASNRRTEQLGRQTRQLAANADAQIARHQTLRDLM